MVKIINMTDKEYFNIDPGNLEILMGIFCGLYVLILIIDLIKIYKSCHEYPSPTIYRQRVFYIIVMAIAGSNI
jgi:hypothetical protein